MKYPESLLVPVFMISDYYLTVVGAVVMEKGYSKHFQSQHYELNPSFQEAIQKKQWFNSRHLALTALISFWLILTAELVGPIYPWLVELMLGMFLVMFAIVIGRHIRNILMFRRVFRKPTEISGQVCIDHTMMLTWSLYEVLGVAFPLAVITALSPTPFTLGGLVGAFSLILTHLRWTRKQRRRRNAKVPESPERDPDLP